VAEAGRQPHIINDRDHFMGGTHEYVRQLENTWAAGGDFRVELGPFSRPFSRRAEIPPFSHLSREFSSQTHFWPFSPGVGGKWLICEYTERFRPSAALAAKEKLPFKNGPISICPGIIERNFVTLGRTVFFRGIE
jgi:hypothetical protein